MTYYLQLCELARTKGIDVEELTENLLMVAFACNASLEYVAESFIRAIEWEPVGQKM